MCVVILVKIFYKYILLLFQNFCFEHIKRVFLLKSIFTHIYIILKTSFKYKHKQNKI